jgi:Ca-activated chloride channel family protein
VEQPVFRSEHAMVIALDLSQSMDAQDLTPSRLTRARLKVLDMLAQRTSGQTALVVYSANAFTVTPLTSDTDTIAALVNSLSTDIMPSRGSNPAAAIAKGKGLLEQAGIRDGEVLLVADGGASPAAEQAAADLREAGYTLSVLGVGTLEGAPIPERGGGFVTDRSGRIAVPKLDSDALEELAEAGGGRYAAVTADDQDIETLLRGAAAGPGAAGGSQVTDQWQEEGPWLLLLLVPLAALAFRRGWVMALMTIAFLPAAEPAKAFSWQDLWRTNDQQARELLEAGEPAAAAELFEDPAWRAVADYRAREYSKSAEGFSARKDADSLYNLGNALARQGEFEPAIEAYEEALALDPELEDAAYNRDLVKELMEQQEAQQGNKGNQQSSSEPGGGAQQSESDSESQQAGEEGASGEASGESQDGESSVRNQEQSSQQDLEALQEELERAAMEAEQQSGDPTEEAQMSQAQLAAERRAQEQQQAMEQWLRRIPNDPGGLLRRKFRYQYQREGMDQDGNQLWPDDEMEPW